MNALTALSGDERVTLAVLAIVGCLFLAALALCAAAGAALGVDVHPDEVNLVEGVGEDGTEECGRCGGSGVLDLETDDWYRPILRDTACPGCDGSGRVEAVWH